MFSILDNSQMTTHTLPEGGTLRKVTQIGGKWIDKNKNYFLPIEKVKVTQIGGKQIDNDKNDFLPIEKLKVTQIGGQMDQ